MRRRLHRHKAAGSLTCGGGELWFLTGHPGHAQEPCGGSFLSGARKGIDRS